MHPLLDQSFSDIRISFSPFYIIYTIKIFLSMVSCLLVWTTHVSRIFLGRNTLLLCLYSVTHRQYSLQHTMCSINSHSNRILIDSWYVGRVYTPSVMEVLGTGTWEFWHLTKLILGPISVGDQTWLESQSLSLPVVFHFILTSINVNEAWRTICL